MAFILEYSVPTGTESPRLVNESRNGL
jgi:hypothetical protein